MQPHLKLLGILQLLWGWIGLLLGVSTLMLAAGAAAIGLTSSANSLSAGATAATFAIFSAALGGLANAWAGAAIRKLQPEGRLATLGLAVPNLFVLPFGTALGVYAFWVLLHDETRKMFGIRS